MTLFGIIWLIYLLYCISRKGYYHILCCLLLAMVLQCDNIVVLGETGIGPQVLTSLAFITYYLIKNHFCIKINRQNKLALLGIFILSIPIFKSVNIENILRVIMLFSYIFTAYLLSTLSSKITEEELYIALYRTTLIVLVIGFTEMLMTSGIVPRIWLFRTFIYNDVVNSQFYLPIIRFFSTFQEASYCAPFLIAMFFYFLETHNSRKSCNYILALLILAIILTFSTTAYVCFLVILLLWALYSQNRKAKKIIIPLSILGLVFMATFGYSIIENVIINKMSSGSGVTRSNWNRSAIQAFQSSKIWGTGYKTQRASSLMYTLLAELGVVGFFGYVIFNLGLVLKKGEPLIRKSSLMIISGVICCFIACPDVDLCSYWLIVYIVLLMESQSIRST